MARRRQRSGARGFGLTFTTEPAFPPDLSDVVVRLKKNKPLWRSIQKDFTSEPDNFEKPDRFIDDRMPYPGLLGEGFPPDAPWFGGGYEGRLRLRPADKRVNITSNRPYVPLYTDDFLDRIADRLVDYWLQSDLSRGERDSVRSGCGT